MKVIFKSEGCKYTAEYKEAITWPEAIELMRVCLIAAYPYLTTQDIVDCLAETTWDGIKSSKVEEENAEVENEDPV